jgi:hypothetical protein
VTALAAIRNDLRPETAKAAQKLAAGHRYISAHLLLITTRARRHRSRVGRVDPGGAGSNPPRRRRAVGALSAPVETSQIDVE